MKKVVLSLTFILGGLIVFAQKPESGVTYGKVGEGKPVPIEKLEKSVTDNKFEGQVTGTVSEVCKAEGCWLKLKKEDGSTVMVRAKDHGFVMPVALEGKTVIVEGAAEVKEISEELRKHYAEDAGKSKKEIKKIKGTEKQIVIQATGVKVV